MNQTLNDLVNEALFQWVKVTGIDLEKESFTIRLDGSLSEWDLKNATEELNQSRDLDETGLTTWMMLRGLVEIFMKDQTFSAFDIVFNPEPIKERLTAMHALHSALEDPQVVELISTFLEKIRSTARKYNFVKMDELETLLDDKHALSFIRRDALRSMERLTPHQFTQGERDPNPLGINPNIYEMWNVNSLVRALRSQNIPGVTTVLIRDPEILHSFFVFAIKNGDNITVFTDKEEDPHPAHRRMSRHRAVERDFCNRVAKHWFPYHLLNVKVAEDQKTLYADARTALVPLNTQAVRLAGVEDLHPEEFVWLMLISELLLDKFWKQNYHTPELSYTGDMVAEPHALVGELGALVTKGLYQPLIVPPLTKNDVTSKATLHQWERTPTYFYQWMLDQYAEQVPDEAFNVIGETNVKLLQEKVTGHGEKIDVFGNVTSLQLETLNTQEFGTKQKLVNDIQWAARVNQTKIVQRLAKKEYEDTYKDLIEWYKNQVFSRKDFFLEATAKGNLIAPYATLSTPKDENGRVINFTEDEHLYLIQKNIMVAQISHRCYGGYYEKDYLSISKDYYGDISLSEYVSHTYYCHDNPEAKANVFTVFSPNCPEALAFILGMKVEDLPWQMQHWYYTGPGRSGLEPYSGNSILDRLDPVDWVLENPWFHLRFHVGVALSKRAFNARRKALGLPHVDVPKQEKGWGCG